MTGRQLDSTGLKRLHRSWRRRTDGRVALVLDNVQSPFNVGAILRTAAALTVAEDRAGRASTGAGSTSVAASPGAGVSLKNTAARATRCRLRSASQCSRCCAASGWRSARSS